MIEYQYRVVMGEQTRTIERLNRIIEELREREADFVADCLQRDERIEQLETGIKQHRANRAGRYVETYRLWSLIDGDDNR